MPGEAVAHGSPAVRPFLQQLALAGVSGALLHVGVGRGEPSAAAGALGVTAFALAVGRSSLSRAALLGVVGGLVAWLPSAGFVVAGAREAGANAAHAAAVAFVVALLHALRLGLAGLLASRLERGGAPLGLATALSWHAAEVLDGAPLPWSLGAATVDMPWLSAAADLGGPPLAGLVIALAGGVVADAGWSVRRVGARRWANLLAPLALGVLVVRGMIATREVEAAARVAPSRRVAAVHVAHRRSLPPLTAPFVRAEVDAAAREADVVVLPEALFWFTSREVAEDVLEATFEGVSAHVLVGAGWGPETAQVNAVAWLAPGSPPRWYVKTRPFPVGEAGDGAAKLLGLRGGPGVAVRGAADAPTSFSLGDTSVAPAICWEDLFADAGARAGDGPGWIAASVNDGWFAGSRAGAQHLQHVRIRSVEARRSMVRSTNEGVTAIVDPLGGVTIRRAGEGHVVAAVPALAGTTLAIRTRGAVSWALAAVTLACALALRSRET